MMRVDFTFKEPVSYKHSERRRHKFTRPRYRVTNWPEYNDGLCRRDEITIRFAEKAMDEWHPTKTGEHGRLQQLHSDHAIETEILISQVFHLPLRQAEWFMISLVHIMGAVVSIPKFSNISERSIELSRHVLREALEPCRSVVVDSTGLKVYGGDNWHHERHIVAARRTWRKLHLVVDECHQIDTCELTMPEGGDPNVVPDLLDQIEILIKTLFLVVRPTMDSLYPRPYLPGGLMHVPLCLRTRQ